MSTGLSELIKYAVCNYHIHTGSEDVFVAPNLDGVFDKMRAKLITLFLKVQEMILKKGALLENVITFLQLMYETLANKMSCAESIEKVLKILLDECTITNIAHLEVIVEFLEIDEAKALIQKYNEEVEEKCNELPLTMSLDYCFKRGLDEQLKCNTITFILGWNPEEKKFKDINGVMWKAFGEKGARYVRVVAVKTTNSIAIICYAPHTVMTFLMMRAKSNIGVLVEEGVVSLFVGYYTVLDHKSREQVYADIISLK